MSSRFSQQIPLWQALKILAAHHGHAPSARWLADRLSGGEATSAARACVQRLRAAGFADQSANGPTIALSESRALVMTWRGWAAYRRHLLREPDRMDVGMDLGHLAKLAKPPR